MLHAPAMETRNESGARGRVAVSSTSDVAPALNNNQTLLRSSAAPVRRPSRVPILQRQCDCGGTCPSCKNETPKLQTKLSINEPGDQYEQEADRVADQVMRMPAPPAQTKI